MTQQEKIVFLIKELQKEMPEYAGYDIPDNAADQWAMLRGLFNVRPAWPASEEFLKIQDEVLTQIAREKGVTDADSLVPTRADSRLVVWQGDITTLKADAIVNAANNQMEELRAQYGKDYLQPTATPMITPGYNLPAKYVIHVVGTIVYPRLTSRHKVELAQCYSSCLDLANENGCESLAFCCISTGVFMFPQDKAAEIAVKTVRKWLDEHQDAAVKRVVFNVFKDEDLRLYDGLLNG